MSSPDIAVDIQSPIEINRRLLQDRRKNGAPSFVFNSSRKYAGKIPKNKI